MNPVGQKFAGGHDSSSESSAGRPRGGRPSGGGGIGDEPSVLAGHFPRGRPGGKCSSSIRSGANWPSSGRLIERNRCLIRRADLRGPPRNAARRSARKAAPLFPGVCRPRISLRITAIRCAATGHFWQTRPAPAVPHARVFRGVQRRRSGRPISSGTRREHAATRRRGPSLVATRQPSDDLVLGHGGHFAEDGVHRPMQNRPCDGAPGAGTACRRRAPRPAGNCFRAAAGAPVGNPGGIEHFSER